MRPHQFSALAGALFALISSPRSIHATACDPAQLFDLQPASAATGVTQVLTGKLDSDALTDLVIVYGATGTIEIRRHVSGTEYTTTSTWTWTAPIQRALLADVDRDGRTDLAFTDNASHVVLYRGVGDGSFLLAKTLTAPYDAFDLVVADLGNGGSLEIVVSHPSSGRVSTFVSTSGLDYTTVTTDISAQVPDPRWLAIGKLNNDTLWDVMVSRGSTGRVYLLKGSGANSVGSGAFTVSSSLLAAGVATSLEVGDLDLDGGADVVIGSNGRVEWVCGPGPTFEVGGSRDVTGGPVTDLLITDADGDGHPDIVAARQSSSRVTTILGTGARALGTSGDAATGIQPASMATSDLGGSPGVDLIVGGGSGMSLLVSRCATAPPPPSPPDSLPPGPGPRPIAIPADPIEGPMPPSLTATPPPDPADPGPTPIVAAWPANGVTVCDAPGAQSELTGTDDFVHGVYFAWIDERSGTRDVYATRLGPDGNRVAGWPANGIAVCAAPGVQRSVTCVTDGPSGVFVVWLDERSGTAALYAQRLTAEGQVAPGWPVDGRLLCTAGDARPVDSYQAWADLLGGLKLGWLQTTGSTTQLVTTRLGPDGLPRSGWPVCATPMSFAQYCPPYTCPSWSCTEFRGYDFRWPEGILYSLATRQVLCPIPELGCSSCISNGATNVNAITPSGSSPIQSISGEDARVFYDQVGGFYVLSYFDIRRYGASGHPSWGPIGIYTSGQGVLPTRLGQFHYLDPTPPYYLLRIDDDGSLRNGFGNSGQPLCGAPCAPAGEPHMIDDGSGGVFAAWPDARGSGDLYATWYRGDGVRGSGWSLDGNVVAALPGAKELGPVVGDQRGAAIVGWRDQRNGDWNLFADRLTSVPPSAAHGPRLVAPEAASRSASGAILSFVGTRPNPNRVGLPVEFSLSRFGTASMSVIDVAGREVLRRRFEGLAPGRHRIELDSNHDLAPGIYVLVLSAEGRRLESKAVVTR